MHKIKMQDGKVIEVKPCFDGFRTRVLSNEPGKMTTISLYWDEHEQDFLRPTSPVDDNLGTSKKDIDLLYQVKDCLNAIGLFDRKKRLGKIA